MEIHYKSVTEPFVLYGSQEGGPQITNSTSGTNIQRGDCVSSAV